MIKGSGSYAILSSCEFSIVGNESMVTLNHIKKARHCHQVLACVMYSLLKTAHEESGDSQSVMDWLKSRSELSEMCQYWHIILQLMLNVVIFVRSIREVREISDPCGTPDLMSDHVLNELFTLVRFFLSVR